MSARTLFAGLSSEEKARLLEKSDLRGLGQAVLHFGLILGLGTAIALEVPFWPLLMPLQGILLVFLFTALHETSHLTAFRSKGLNRAVAWLAGFLIFLPPRWFGYFHFAHHRYTQDPLRDPELSSPKPKGLAQYLLHLTGLPVWRSQGKTLLANARGRFDSFVPSSQRANLRREARLQLFLYAVIVIAAAAFGLWQILTVWLVPLLMGQPFLRLFLLPEHGDCPQSDDILECTRSTFTNALVSRLSWNMPYHAEHHSFPGVPFHQLPSLNKLMRARLKVTAPGYAAFHRDYLKESLA